MPAGFRRHLVGKTLIDIFHCVITQIHFVCNVMLIRTFPVNQVNQRIECYLYNTINLRFLTPRILPRYYPQNGDRIVAVDSVTSFHRMCNSGARRFAVADFSQVSFSQPPRALHGSRAFNVLTTAIRCWPITVNGYCTVARVLYRQTIQPIRVRAACAA